MGVVFRDFTDRKRAEEQRDLLVKELEHRVKNTLSIVQSIAAQTFRSSGVDPAVQRAFEARLITLSNVHGVLTQSNWDSAELHDVVSSALRPHDALDRARFTVAGPALRLGPKSAVALSMAVHELCTNAIKYGALSSEAGHVDITWSDADGRLRWQWRERGGPPVTQPTRTGFGSRMIERALAMQLSGKVTIDYQRDRHSSAPSMRRSRRSGRTPWPRRGELVSLPGANVARLQHLREKRPFRRRSLAGDCRAAES